MALEPPTSTPPNTMLREAKTCSVAASRHSSQGPPLHQILQTQAIMVLLDRRHLAAILVLASQNSNQFSGQTGGFQTPHGQSTVAHAGSDVLIATAGSNPLVFDFLAKQMESKKAKENAEKILKLIEEQGKEENKRRKEADETPEKSEKKAAEKREKSEKDANEMRERFHNKKIDTARAFNADEAEKFNNLVQSAKKVVQKTPGPGPILATSLFSPTKAIDSKPAATGPKKRCRFDDSAPASGTRRTPLGPHPAANSPSGRPTPSQLFSTPSWSNPAGSARGGDGNTTVPMEEDQEDQAGAKRFTGAPPVFNNGNLKPSNTRGRP
ncbi:unnamed protein product [Cylindrotheca closterium]|uniref:Uncharacterized protein n=1 Tax=Cylindrotheca closterium TaxID=2856 RepID=A0AAD2JJS6_9STRA|nr:unnamed protein product [Cylindrotheca closterium]